MSRYGRRSYGGNGYGYDDERAVVYTDGACSNNGYDGARAGIGVYWGPDDSRNVSEPLDGRPTNNRAEIWAVIRAILQAKDDGFSEVEIRTDSKFLIQAMQKWIHKWQRNNWTTANGTEVANRDDFEELLDASEGIDVIYKFVNGHAGIHGNEQADSLARAGMEEYY